MNKKAFLLSLIFSFAFSFFGLFNSGLVNAQLESDSVTAFNFRGARISTAGVRVTPYQTGVTLADGESVRLRFAVSINEDTDVNFYSNFGRDGAFGWVEDPSFTRHGDSPVAFALPTGKSVIYKPNSTLYQECDIALASCGSVQSISDNANGETPIFDILNRNLIYEVNKQYFIYYDLQVVDTPDPDFNIHDNDQPTFQVRNVTKDSAFSTNLVDVDPGDELEFFFYIHNNPRGSVAENVKIGVENWPSPESISNNFSITGFISSDNAPYKSGNLNITFNSPSQLQFMSGSGNWTGWPTATGQQYYEYLLSDSIVTPTGVGIGEYGRIDGCWDFLSNAYFRTTVLVSESPTPTPTPTATPTPEISPSPTTTPTPVPTLTPTPIPTEVPTPTAAPTVSPTITPSPNPTPVITPVPTVVPTIAPTENPTPTITPTPIPTDVPEITPAPTPVPTETPVVTPTPIEEVLPTVTPTAVPTQAPQPTPTATPIPTNSPEITPTPTPTATPTLSASPTPESSPSPTATPDVLLRVVVPTPTPVASTISPTQTPVATQVPTPAPTPQTEEDRGIGGGDSVLASNDTNNSTGNGSSGLIKEVLGAEDEDLDAEELAGTGVFEDLLMNSVFSFGVFSTGVGVILSRKNKE